MIEAEASTTPSERLGPLCPLGMSRPHFDNFSPGDWEALLELGLLSNHEFGQA